MRRALAAAVIGSLGAMAIVVSGAKPASNPEVRRIQAHFDSVLTELGARDVRILPAKQRAARTSVIVMLGAYRDRGVFPNNYDFPGAAVPYFVDRKTGTLCAVGHLLAATGRRDIVDRVAKLNNNVWVADLAGDTAFAGWLGANGLTFAEAARIQVPYMAPPAQTQPVSAPIRKSNVEVRAAVGAMSLATFYFTTRGYLRHRQMVAAKRDAAKMGLSVAPTISRTDGAGVSFTLRF